LRNILLFIFFHGEENEPIEDARVPLTLRVAKPDNEAAPHAALRRCSIRSGAHNLAIALRLASLGALHDSMRLASLTGFNRSGLAETRCAPTSPRAISDRWADARRGMKGISPGCQRGDIPIEIWPEAVDPTENQFALGINEIVRWGPKPIDDPKFNGVKSND
jgi:hypothetical protein